MSDHCPGAPVSTFPRVHVQAKPCDGNPLHAPPMATFTTTSNGDTERLDLCEPCLRDRLDRALDNAEHFTVSAAPLHLTLAQALARREANLAAQRAAAITQPYPRLMSDL